MADRPYLFFELTNSLCSRCLRKVEAKVVFQEGRVYLHKFCPEHKAEKVLISTDVDYYQFSRRTLKPGQMPLKFNTPIERGCPYDCGLCPDHEQHSCLALVEITDHCNLTCPVCYAESSPRRVTHRSLEQIAFMLDCVVRNEGRPDVVQISGGEPTIHPEFFAVLDLARRAADQAPDGQHQRHPDRPGTRLRPAAGRVHAGVRGLPPVRLAGRGPAARAARGRPRRCPRAGRSTG